jgi:hypothetical protein
LGLGLAAAHAWLLFDLALYSAIRLDHPIRGWRPDRSRVFSREHLRNFNSPMDPPALQIRWWEFKLKEIRKNQERDQLKWHLIGS